MRTTKTGHDSDRKRAATRRDATRAPAARSADHGSVHGPITDWSASLAASPEQLARFDGALVQLRSGGADLPADVPAVAAAGVRGGGSELPFRDRIMAAFGRHDVSGVRAHVGSDATRANDALGSLGYTTGESVAFRGAPSLFTAAHEAAHVVQQRAGVRLRDGVGRRGDAYEQHADAVAAKVVRGESAEGLLDVFARGAGPAGGGGPVQLRGDEAARVDDAALTQSVQRIRARLSADDEDGAWNELVRHQGESLAVVIGRLGTDVATRLFEAIGKDKLEDEKGAPKLDALRVIKHLPALAETTFVELMSYGVFDWAITDAEAVIAFQILQTVRADTRKKIIDNGEGKYWERLKANMPSWFLEQSSTNFYDRDNADNRKKVGALWAELAGEEVWKPANAVRLAGLIRMLVAAGRIDDVERRCHAKGLHRSPEGRALLYKNGMAPEPGAPRSLAPDDPSLLGSIGNAAAMLLTDVPELLKTALTGGGTVDVDLNKAQAVMGGRLAGARLDDAAAKDGPDKNTLQIDFDTQSGRFAVGVPNLGMAKFVTQSHADGKMSRVEVGRSAMAGMLIEAKWPTQRDRAAHLEMRLAELSLNDILQVGDDAMRTVGQVALTGLVIRAEKPPWPTMPQSRHEYVQLVVRELLLLLPKLAGALVDTVFGTTLQPFQDYGKLSTSLVDALKGLQGLEVKLATLRIEGVYDDASKTSLDSAELKDVTLSSRLVSHVDMLRAELAAARARGEQRPDLEGQITSLEAMEAERKTLQNKVDGHRPLSQRERDRLKTLRERLMFLQIRGRVGSADAGPLKQAGMGIGGAHARGLELGVDVRAGHLLNDQGGIDPAKAAALKGDDPAAKQAKERMLQGSSVTLRADEVGVRGVEKGEGEERIAFDQATVHDLSTSVRMGEKGIEAQTSIGRIEADQVTMMPPEFKEIAKDYPALKESMRRYGISRLGREKYDLVEKYEAYVRQIELKKMWQRMIRDEEAKPPGTPAQRAERDGLIQRCREAIADCDRTMGRYGTQVRKLTVTDVALRGGLDQALSGQVFGGGGDGVVVGSVQVDGAGSLGKEVGQARVEGIGMQQLQDGAAIPVRGFSVQGARVGDDKTWTRIGGVVGADAKASVWWGAQAPNRFELTLGSLTLTDFASQKTTEDKGKAKVSTTKLAELRIQGVRLAAQAMPFEAPRGNAGAIAQGASQFAATMAQKLLPDLARSASNIALADPEAVKGVVNAALGQVTATLAQVSGLTLEISSMSLSKLESDGKAVDGVTLGGIKVAAGFKRRSEVLARKRQEALTRNDAARAEQLAGEIKALGAEETELAALGAKLEAAKGKADAKPLTADEQRRYDALRQRVWVAEVGMEVGSLEVTGVATGDATVGRARASGLRFGMTADAGALVDHTGNMTSVGQHKAAAQDPAFLASLAGGAEVSAGVDRVTLEGVTQGKGDTQTKVDRVDVRGARMDASLTGERASAGFQVDSVGVDGVSTASSKLVAIREEIAKLDKELRGRRDPDKEKKRDELKEAEKKLAALQAERAALMPEVSRLEGELARRHGGSPADERRLAEMKARARVLHEELGAVTARSIALTDVGLSGGVTNLLRGDGGGGLGVLDSAAAEGGVGRAQIAGMYGAASAEVVNVSGLALRPTDDGGHEVRLASIGVGGLGAGAITLGRGSIDDVLVRFKLPTRQSATTYFKVSANLSLQDLFIAGKKADKPGEADKPDTRVAELRVSALSLEASQPPVSDAARAGEVASEAQSAVTRAANAAVVQLGGVVEAQTTGDPDRLVAALKAAVAEAVAGAKSIGNVRLSFGELSVKGVSGPVTIAQASIKDVSVAMGIEPRHEAASKRVRALVEQLSAATDPTSRTRLEAELAAARKELDEARTKATRRDALTLKKRKNQEDPRRAPGLTPEEMTELKGLDRWLTVGTLEVGVGEITAQGVEADGTKVGALAMRGRGPGGKAVSVSASFAGGDLVDPQGRLDPEAGKALAKDPNAVGRMLGSVRISAELGRVEVSNVVLPARYKLDALLKEQKQLAAQAEAGPLSPEQVARKAEVDKLVSELGPRTARLRELEAMQAKGALTPQQKEELTVLTDDLKTTLTTIESARAEGVGMSVDEGLGTARMGVASAEIRGVRSGDVSVDRASLAGLSVEGRAGGMGMPGGLMDVGALVRGDAQGQAGVDVRLAHAQVSGVTQGTGAGQRRVDEASIEGLRLQGGMGSEGLMGEVGLDRAHARGVHLGAQLAQWRERLAKLEMRQRVGALTPEEGKELEAIHASLAEHAKLVKELDDKRAALGVERAHRKLMSDANYQVFMSYRREAGEGNLSDEAHRVLAERSAALRLVDERIAALVAGIEGLEKQIAALTEDRVIGEVEVRGVGVRGAVPSLATLSNPEALLASGTLEGTGEDGRAVESVRVSGMANLGANQAQLGAVKIRQDASGTRHVSVGPLSIGGVDLAVGGGVLQAGAITIGPSSVSVHTPRGGDDKKGFAEISTGVQLSDVHFRGAAMVDLGAMSLESVTVRADAAVPDKVDQASLRELFTRHLQSASIEVKNVALQGVRVNATKVESVSLGSVGASADLTSGAVGVQLSRLAVQGGSGLGPASLEGFGMQALELSARSGALASYVAQFSGDSKDKKVEGKKLAESFLEGTVQSRVAGVSLSGLTASAGGAVVQLANGYVASGVVTLIPPSERRQAAFMASLPLHLGGARIALGDGKWVEVETVQATLSVSYSGGKLAKGKSVLDGIGAAFADKQALRLQAKDVAVMGVETAWDGYLKAGETVISYAMPYVGHLIRLKDMLRQPDAKTASLFVDSVQIDNVFGPSGGFSLSLKNPKAVYQGFMLDLGGPMASAIEAVAAWIGN